MPNTYFEPMGIGEMLDAGIDLFKKNFKKLYLITFLGYLPLAVIIIIAVAAAAAIGTYELGFMIIFGLIVLILSIPAMIAIVAMQGALIKACDDSLFDREIEVKEGLRFGLKRFFPYFIALLLSGLATAFGYLLLIVPGILFQTWFFLISPVVFLEDNGYASALGRSRELVRGYFWRTFGFIVVMGLLGFAMIGAISQVISLIPVIGTVTGVFIQIAIMPLQAIATTLYFYNQKAILEGHDLKLRADYLYSQPEGKGDVPVV
ncbi:hypothetical protein [Phosphitispora fastidiosa]|uniref:hypothetical protein n=1 Tax=Phosphitispora fastidiosa TaxID=2837202 RepID=UPI001E36A5FD|nr:hypothetical protein [Phosphitispora fastidiosa]MBU7006826.1 hypothetical protein [Phosphitispora fastidiosa]